MGKLTKMYEYKGLWLMILFIGFLSCEKFEPERVVKVETGSLSSFTSSSCVASGTIVDPGEGIVKEYGHCWSEEMNPTISDDRYIYNNKNSAGRFVGNVPGLNPTTKYYIRAYAINNNITYYGGNRDFTTLSNEVVTDIDGNTYSMVSIGTQIWMRENLKTTKFNNGDLIGTTVPANLSISAESNPVYQWPWNRDEGTVDLYGRLYTCYAVMDERKLCPTGWHVPSRADWVTLIANLGGAGTAGGKLKESGITHWNNPNEGASNESGFTALPGGMRSPGGSFWGSGGNGYWWTTTENSPTEAWYIYLYSNNTTALEVFSMKNYAYSVRCVKD